MGQHTNKFTPKKDEIYREDWFPTNIFWVDHPTADKTNSRLKKDINKWHDRDTKGIVRSNSLEIIGNDVLTFFNPIIYFSTILS